jgi:hypothetical protein
VRRVHLATQDIDKLGVFEEQFGRLLAARHAEFALKVPHEPRSRAAGSRAWATRGRKAMRVRYGLKQA